MNTPLDPAEPAGAFTIDRFCKVYGVGRTTTYELIKNGSLRARKAGMRTLILVRDAEDWANALPTLRPVAA